MAMSSRSVPTCQTGWKPMHEGCPVCGPSGPCLDPEYEAIIQAQRGKRLYVNTLLFVCGIVLLLALAACQSAPVKDRVVEVVKPVAVQPIKPEQVPVLPSPLPPRPDSLSAAADVLLGKVCEFVAYALKADPLLKVSA